MQLDRFRIAHNAIFGAIGGLAGWAVISLLLRFETTSTPLLLLKDALMGALVGLCIGLAIGAADQTADGWARRKLPRIGLSGLIGLGAGLVGLVIGEVIFLWAGGGVWPRAVGWAIFGLLLGIGQWPVTGLQNKGVYAGLGGLLGGLIGGATYERLSLTLLGLGAGRELRADGRRRGGAGDPRRVHRPLHRAGGDDPAPRLAALHLRAARRQDLHAGQQPRRRHPGAQRRLRHHAAPRPGGRRRPRGHRDQAAAPSR
jgi:hypothetical protein